MSRGRVLAVAHKGGNSLAALAAAAALGVDIVELDVQPVGGLEVRHARDLAPLPLLFDRGRLRRGWGPRLRLDEVLDTADELLPDSTRLLLDLKGTVTGIGAQVAETLAGRARARTGRDYLVCGRHWPALEPFSTLPHVRVMLSAGSPRQLDELRSRVAMGALVAGRPAGGASIRHSLLTAQAVAELHEVLPLVLAWTVNAPADLDRVLATGVSGVISDRPDFLRRLSATQQA